MATFLKSRQRIRTKLYRRPMPRKEMGKNHVAQKITMEVVENLRQPLTMSESRAAWFLLVQALLLLRQQIWRTGIYASQRAPPNLQE